MSNTPKSIPTITPTHSHRTRSVTGMLPGNRNGVNQSNSDTSFNTSHIVNTSNPVSNSNIKKKKNKNKKTKRTTQQHHNTLIEPEVEISINTSNVPSLPADFFGSNPDVPVDNPALSTVDPVNSTNDPDNVSPINSQGNSLLYDNISVPSDNRSDFTPVMSNSDIQHVMLVSTPCTSIS